MKALSRTSLAAGVVLLCALSGVSLRAQVIVEDLVNVRFQPDVRLFAVMAAVNAAGFDLDANVLPEKSTRALVRAHLAAVSPELKSRLREFYALVAQAEPPAVRQSRFVSYALLLNGPPAFANPFKREEVPEEARPVYGFEKLVAELWRQAGLAALWKQVSPLCVDEIESYRPMIRGMIIDVLKYAHTEARVALDRQVTFIPDLLNAFGVVNARNIANTYVVVVGPSRAREVPLRSIRHEYLHFLLDPLIAKYRGRLPDPAPFLAQAALLKGAERPYQADFNMLLTESLIRGLELRLNPETRFDASARTIELYDQGMILAPYFAESFQKFEARTEPLPVYFPELFSGLTWDQESKRAEAIDRLRAAAAAKAAAPPPTEDPSQQEVKRLLLEGNRFLQTKQYDKAAEVLSRASQVDPGNASALFGLGQASMQLQKFEQAIDLYSKAAAAAKPEENWIAAWSYVHRGKMFRFLDQPDKAKAEWERVLQLSGDLHGAAEAAHKALSEK